MIRFLFAALALLVTHPACAVPWSLGSVVEHENSGLSLLYRHRPREAIHLSAAFFQNERLVIEGDWQRFFIPYGRLFDYQLYSGAGLRGEAIEGEDKSEIYQLSLPLGLQWNPEGLPVELFAEVGALLGPLPATKATGRVRGGLRAMF